MDLQDRTRGQISEGLAVVHFLVVKLGGEIDSGVPSRKRSYDALGGEKILCESALNVALHESLLKGSQITSVQTPGGCGKAASRNACHHIDLMGNIRFHLASARAKGVRNVF